MSLSEMIFGNDKMHSPPKPILKKQSRYSEIFVPVIPFVVIFNKVNMNDCEE